MFFQNVSQPTYLYSNAKVYPFQVLKENLDRPSTHKLDLTLQPQRQEPKDKKAGLKTPELTSSLQN